MTRVRELAGLIAEVVGEGANWSARITATTSVEDDLELEGADFAELATALRSRYGDRVDLLHYLAGLDLDRLIELTVGDLAGYVDGALR